jgi:hypothetical protein
MPHHPVHHVRRLSIRLVPGSYAPADIMWLIGCFYYPTSHILLSNLHNSSLHIVSVSCSFLDRIHTSIFVFSVCEWVGMLPKIYVGSVIPNTYSMFSTLGLFAKGERKVDGTDCLFVLNTDCVTYSAIITLKCNVRHAVLRISAMILTQRLEG